MGLLKVCVNMECDSSGLSAVIHELGYSGSCFQDKTLSPRTTDGDFSFILRGEGALFSLCLRNIQGV